MGWFGGGGLIVPEMVRINPGRFLMGSPEGEEGRDPREGPQHEVVIDYHFEVGKYPVTFREWDSAAQQAPAQPLDRELRRNPPDEGWGRGWRPVINISWNDAQGYIRFLNERTGRGYRLLSEAEWEYCCRAGATTAYAFGETLTNRSQGVVFSYDRTVEVNRLPPNRWGLASMHGNAWEWCQDVWNHNYAEPGRPDDGSPWLSGETTRRVSRGGSFDSPPEGVRSATRFGSETGSRAGYSGFRIARSL
jgi:formylglycine-generating enzyme required for sulfatase activity